MDPRAFPPPPGSQPLPNWPQIQGGTLPPPPPGWAPFPAGMPPPFFPVGQLPLKAPNPFTTPSPPGFQGSLFSSQPFLPLGALPPPPPGMFAANPPAPPPTAIDPSFSSFTSPRRPPSGETPFRPRQNTLPSAASSAGRSTPRARSASAVAAGVAASDSRGSRPGSPWASSLTQQGASSLSPRSPNSARSASPGPLRPQGAFRSGSASPGPSSRPSSGRTPAKRTTSAPPRRGGSARLQSALSSGCGGGVTSLDNSDNIKVAVRVRPLNSNELARGDVSVLEPNVNGDRQVVLTLPPTAPPQWAASTSVPQSAQCKFPFHACIGPEMGQDDVMKMCGIPQLLDAALDGYNATILAYGQTGSGKTYTISGYDEMQEYPLGQSGIDDGIVSRSLSYIFAQVESRNAALAAVEAAAAGVEAAQGYSIPIETPSAAPLPLSDGCRYSVRASYSEIYNEALYDLLVFDERQLSIRWEPGRGFHAPDISIQPCQELQDALAVVACGLRHRRVGSHALNLESSRSHSILTVYIDTEPMRPDAVDYGSVRMGKVVFVDLAGSERLKDSQSEGYALRETASINRSLFMLGKVISALAAGAKGAVVPYRESKLTKLLMDSLGGSALSLMIACCSPSSAHIDETLSTLSYATRAKNIRNAPTVQVDPQQAAMAALRRELRLLRTENAFLRDQIALLSSTKRHSQQLEVVHSAAQDALLQPGSPNAGNSLPASSVLIPVPPAAQEELVRRLSDAQNLLNTLSSENSRLAAENERLRAGGLQVAGDYSGAVDEIDWLRSKLTSLEMSLRGAAVGEDPGGFLLLPPLDQAASPTDFGGKTELDSVLDRFLELPDSSFEQQQQHQGVGDAVAEAPQQEAEPSAEQPEAASGSSESEAAAVSEGMGGSSERQEQSSPKNWEGGGNKGPKRFTHFSGSSSEEE